ncbi:metal ABC transporter solute-binding protein, Zn/Mn family [Methanohalophilus mahii]|uniref:Periplasmic solute binding protein n=1 Tax=Methanohalophilus mahii (strain ATCC 35705 / DSM 5219 / SLP) TaxID=547558 RepID=D5E6V1_METMS|nr:zinc ABC transporter substrate-binding protein [Methanohalophilus mahii]ADE36889.1 periplasmic solute binding protein [Methanohalophilus mahii DSM 5219]
MMKIFSDLIFWSDAKKAFLLLLTIVLIATSGCMEENDADAGGQEKITVAVSVLPQAEFVEKVGGDRVEVVVMIPPGASPHSYEPRPSQLTELSNAEMYAMVGSGIPMEDSMMSKLADLNPDMLVVDCSDGIDFLKEEHDHTHENDHMDLDPHIWTSPDNAKIMVENIYSGLVEIDPENQETYSKNKNTYISELDALDEQIKKNIEGKEGSSFMVYHPAWGYFAERYDLNMVPIETEGKEASARQLSEIITFAKQENITVIFVQAQFSTQSAEAVAEEIDGKVVKVDPLARNYTENMYKVSEAFREGLK